MLYIYMYMYLNRIKSSICNMHEQSNWLRVSQVYYLVSFYSSSMLTNLLLNKFSLNQFREFIFLII